MSNTTGVYYNKTSSTDDIKILLQWGYLQTEQQVVNHPQAIAVSELVLKEKKITHDDIPVTSVKPLNEIRREFLASGYSNEDVESMIEGLSELPEYASSKHKQTRGKEDK